MKKRELPTFRWKYWIAFNATVFVASACVMIVEILSTRLVAQHLGASLYTWTSAIGVVLSGISLGNYLGGRIADRYHPRRSLSLLFLLSALSCITIPLINYWVGNGALLEDFRWPTRIFWHFAITFLVPATLLGTMSPVVARMALNLGRAPGQTIGTIYAWGAIGSIVGTFGAGFFLIAWAGTTSAIFCVSAILAVVGLLYGYRSWLPYAGSAALLLFSLLSIGPWTFADRVGTALGIRQIPEEGVLLEVDSAYQRVSVRESGDGNVRTLVLDALIHSQIDLSRPDRLLYKYELVYAEVLQRTHPGARPLTALFIGGGGLVFPRYLEEKRPGSTIEVAEIDPVVTRVAREMFAVPAESKIRCHDLDARNYVADLLRRQERGESVPRFDVIFGDAFNDVAIPFHLTTLDFTRMLERILAADGVYMLNLVDVYASSQFLSAVWNTYRQVFPHVEVFATTSLTSDRNTFVLACSRRPFRLESVPESIRQGNDFDGLRLGDQELAYLEQASAGVVLTDDYAPVENLVAPTLWRKKPPPRDFAEALGLIQAHEMGEAERRLREGLKKQPGHHGMLNELGHVLGKTGRPGEAREFFRRAVRLAPLNANYRSNYALSLQESGLDALAAEQYRAYLKLMPGNPAALNSLARLLATSPDEQLRDGPEAVRLAEELLRRVGPDNHAVQDTLAAAYARAGSYDQAVAAAGRAVRRARAVGSEREAAAYAGRLSLYRQGQPYVEEARAPGSPGTGSR